MQLDLIRACSCEHHQCIKLIDFGLVGNPENLGQDLLKTCCGSAAYAAPELIRGDKYLGKPVSGSRQLASTSTRRFGSGQAVNPQVAAQLSFVALYIYFLAPFPSLCFASLVLLLSFRSITYFHLGFPISRHDLHLYSCYTLYSLSLSILSSIYTLYSLFSLYSIFPLYFLRSFYSL